MWFSPLFLYVNVTIMIIRKTTLDFVTKINYNYLSYILYYLIVTKIIITIVTKINYINY